MGGGTAEHEARRNLLYMLAVSGDVAVRSRDIARLAARRASLSETLAEIFADQAPGASCSVALSEGTSSRRKPQAVQRQTPRLRHVVRNAAHRERFWCRYDEFVPDTPMNRIFRASCRVLLDGTRTPATQDTLRQCLLLLDAYATSRFRTRLSIRSRLTAKREIRRRPAFLEINSLRTHANNSGGR